MSKRLLEKYPLFLSDFNETCIFSRDFRESLNIKSNQKASSGNRVVPCRWTEGRTDGHDEANSLFSQFCEKRLKIRNLIM